MRQVTQAINNHLTPDCIKKLEQCAISIECAMDKLSQAFKASTVNLRALDFKCYETPNIQLKKPKNPYYRIKERW